MHDAVSADDEVVRSEGTPSANDTSTDDDIAFTDDGSIDGTISADDGVVRPDGAPSVDETSTDDGIVKRKDAPSANDERGSADDAIASVHYGVDNPEDSRSADDERESADNAFASVDNTVIPNSVVLV